MQERSFLCFVQTRNQVSHNFFFLLLMTWNRIMHKKGFRILFIDYAGLFFVDDKEGCGMKNLPHVTWIYYVYLDHYFLFEYKSCLRFMIRFHPHEKTNVIHCHWWNSAFRDRTVIYFFLQTKLEFTSCVLCCLNYLWRWSEASSIISLSQISSSSSTPFWLATFWSFSLVSSLLSPNNHLSFSNETKPKKIPSLKFKMLQTSRCCLFRSILKVQYSKPKIFNSFLSIRN